MKNMEKLFKLNVKKGVQKINFIQRENQFIFLTPLKYIFFHIFLSINSLYFYQFF